MIEAREVPGYRLDALVHRGPRTDVWRGEELASGRPVMVKLHRDSLPLDREVAAQRRAYQLARRADASPLVVEHLALVPVGRDLALITEDFGGVGLDRWLRDVGRTSIDEVIRIAITIAEALAVLHGAGIVHKDVKPANVVHNPESGRVALIDLGIASALRADVAESKLAEGTLRYAAPEQTGRVNRPVDRRADLYALGATLFHLIAGRPPFEADDTLDLVHAHIALSAPSLRALRADVPRSLSAMIARLLSKNAEDRYQSARGLLHDLRQLASAREQGALDPDLPLATRDFTHAFSIPDVLYGREAALDALQRSFGDAQRGGVCLQLVAGSSGVGKSALVAELQRPIVSARASFASGKFDLFRRDLPYLAWIEVLSSLVDQALALPEAALAPLRARLVEALGSNMGVVAQLVPEVASILGAQPPPPEVSSGEAQARFVRAFRRFVGAFAQPDRPLVVFVDDLQWADLPSLDLLEALVTGPDAAHLLVLGAYRDNEVAGDHPLRAMLRRLSTSRCRLGELLLPPLGLQHVAQLVADTLRITAHEADDLAGLIFERTEGNPFFVRQLLEALHRGGLLTLDASSGSWRWDMPAVRAEGVTDDVAALLAARIAALPEPTRAALEVASCIGASFDLQTLADVLGAGMAQMSEDLEPALVAELLVPLDASYKLAGSYTESTTGSGEASCVNPRYRFLHDRVEAVAHAGLSAEASARNHLTIARLLMKRSGDDADEVLPNIASHLCEASALLPSEPDRAQVVSLLLRAARRAKASLALAPAQRFLDAGLALLPAHPWRDAYDLALGLHTESAEVAYIQGRFSEVAQHARQVLEGATTPLDRLPVRMTQIGVGVSQLRYVEATHLAVDVLRGDFELRFPKNPSMLHVLGGLAAMKWAMGRRSPRDLLELPRMTSPEVRAALGVMMKSATNAYWGVPNLVPMLAFRMIRLSLRYGNDGLSAYGYALYGMIASAALGLVSEGYAFGQLAMDLLDRTGDEHLLGRTGLLWHGFIRHHRDPYRDAAAALMVCYHQAQDAGDVENATYCATVSYYTDLLSGRPIATATERIEPYLPALFASGQDQTIYALRVWLQAAAQLQARVTPRTRLDGAYIHFDPKLDALVANNERMAVAQGTCAAGWLAFLLHDADAALHYLTLLDDHRDDAPGQTFLPHCQVLLAILHCRMGRGARVARIQRMVRGRAARNPGDFAALSAWLEAERLHARQKLAAAAHAYVSAASLARRVSNLWIEGAVLERLAQLHDQSGHDDAARDVLLRARSAWKRFGAWAKLVQLGDASATEATADDPTYTLSTLAHTSTRDGLGELDVRAMLEAVRAVSSEIQLDKLVSRVLHVSLLATGARRGMLFLLNEDGEPHLEAAAEVHDTAVEVLAGQAAADMDIPEAMVRYALRTRQVLLIDDALSHERFARDPYVVTHGTRAVLCAPLSSQGKTVGLLFLDNELGADVFTATNVQVIEAVGGQAAVALQNARLFDAQRSAAEAFARFVPKPFLQHLGRKRIEDVALGDASEATVSVLFADLRDFTSISERLSAADTFALINRYLAAVGPAVEAHGGFIDKFIGDAVMALFPGDAAAAIHAGVAMHRALDELNVALVQEGLAPLRMGIGIHTGPAMLGTIGSRGRMETTVIGDTVNLASRLEGQSKVFLARLLISEATFDATDASTVVTREVGRVRVKGRTRPVRVFEVLDARPKAERDALRLTRAGFEAALGAFVHGRMDAAAAGFSACAEQAPVDALATQLGERARSLGAGSLPEDWDGVEDARVK